LKESKGKNEEGIYTADLLLCFFLFWWQNL